MRSVESDFGLVVFLSKAGDLAQRLQELQISTMSFRELRSELSVKMHPRILAQLRLTSCDVSLGFVEIMKALGYPRLISLDSFRLPNFELVADCLFWLFQR